MGEQLKWYHEKAADNSPWIDALAELRQRATREGHCFQHVQAITVAIDQYAEGARQPRLLSQQTLRRGLSPFVSAVPRGPKEWQLRCPTTSELRARNTAFRLVSRSLR